MAVLDVVAVEHEEPVLVVLRDGSQTLFKLTSFRAPDLKDKLKQLR